MAHISHKGNFVYIAYMLRLQQLFSKIFKKKNYGRKGKGKKNKITTITTTNFRDIDLFVRIKFPIRDTPSLC